MIQEDPKIEDLLTLAALLFPHDNYDTSNNPYSVRQYYTRSIVDIERDPL